MPIYSEVSPLRQRNPDTQPWKSRFLLNLPDRPADTISTAYKNLPNMEVIRHHHTCAEAHAANIKLMVEIDLELGLHYEVGGGRPTSAYDIMNMNKAAAARYDGLSFQEAHELFSEVMEYLEIDTNQPFYTLVIWQE